MSDWGCGELVLELVLTHGIHAWLIGPEFVGMRGVSKTASVLVAQMVRVRALQAFAKSPTSLASGLPNCLTNAAMMYAVFQRPSVAGCERAMFLEYARAVALSISDGHRCRMFGPSRHHRELAFAVYMHMHRIRRRLASETSPSSTILRVVHDMTNLVRMSGVRIQFGGEHALDVLFGGNSVHPTYSETRVLGGWTISRVFLHVCGKGSSHVEWARREMNEVMPGMAEHGAREVTVHVQSTMHANTQKAAAVLAVVTVEGAVSDEDYMYYPTDKTVLFPLCVVGTRVSAVGGGRRIDVMLCDQDHPVPCPPKMTSRASAMVAPLCVVSVCPARRGGTIVRVQYGVPYAGRETNMMFTAAYMLNSLAA
jgi:hypothetical protein